MKIAHLRKCADRGWAARLCSLAVIYGPQAAWHEPLLFFGNWR